MQKRGRDEIDEIGQALKNAPQALDAERSVLGAMLLNNSVIEDVQMILRVENFYSETHRTIYGAIVDMRSESPVDPLTLGDWIDKKLGKLEAVGGREYLDALQDCVVSSANVQFHAGIVKEKAMIRKLLATCARIERLCAEPGAEAEILTGQAEQLVFDIRQGFTGSNVVPIKDILVEAFQFIDRQHQQGITGIETGFYRLDDILHGLQKGELIILAARPSVGKTSMALNILDRAATQDNKKSMIFSCEMTAMQLVNNLLCLHGHVESDAIRRGTLTEKDYDNLARAADRFSQAPIFIDDTGGILLPELMAKARRQKRQTGLDLVIVDYIQIVRTASRLDRHLQVAEISGSLKMLAKELDVPVLALSQLSRDVEKRGQRPKLSDLRESGSIEQDADVVIMLHRPDLEQELDDDQGGRSQDVRQIEVIVGKNRNGQQGLLQLQFRGRYFRFENPNLSA